MVAPEVEPEDEAIYDAPPGDKVENHIEYEEEEPTEEEVLQDQHEQA